MASRDDYHRRQSAAASSSPPSSLSSSSAKCSLTITIAVIGGALLLCSAPPCAAVGYSYTRFVGPVAGPEERVYVRDDYSGDARLDYVAQPAYEFAYGIEDGEMRLLQNRKETRNGDAVKGVYSVIDPDGTLRVVKYIADDINGFQAEVITNGVTMLHGHAGDNSAPQQELHVRHEPRQQPAQDGANNDARPGYEVNENDDYGDDDGEDDDADDGEDDDDDGAQANDASDGDASDDPDDDGGSSASASEEHTGTYGDNDSQETDKAAESNEHY